MTCSGSVLAVDGAFADEGKGDTDGSEQERLSTSDAVEEEDNEDQIYTVVSI